MIRRFISVVFLSLVCVLFLCACSSDGNTDPTVADGSMIPVTEASGTVTGYERYFHNSEGYLSRTDYFSADEELDHYVLYDYDSEGRVSRETTYAANGIGQFFYQYEYDENGDYSCVTYVTQGEGYTVTWYENGEEQEIYSMDAQGNIVSHQEKQNGEWVETPADETTASE